MKIETGEPTKTGRYACYMHGVEVATVIRFWLPGTGWLNNLQEPVAGSVAGWVGPLPVMPKSADDYSPAAAILAEDIDRRLLEKTTPEYDL